MNKPFLHPSSDVQTSSISSGTRVCQYVVIHADARIGDDCNICSHVLIENDVIVGDRVTVKCGVQLCDGLRIADDVFIGPNVSFTNDRFPRSRQKRDAFLTANIQERVSVGAGAVILPGIVIGSKAMIGAGAGAGAGAVATRSVPPNSVVVGNPAKIVGYVDTMRSSAVDMVGTKDELGAFPTNVSGVTLHRMPNVADIRGRLTVGEFERSIPFPTKRYFMVFDVPNRETLGEHAHRECHQFLICIRGNCTVVADDGRSREEFVLDRLDLGIHLKPGVWGVQYKYSADAVLLVFASHYYDAADYIRDYSEFCQFVEGRK